MLCENPDHTAALEKLDGSLVCSTCKSNTASWEPPFVAVLFNEAGEPHHEKELTVCSETIASNGMLYRLIEFSRDGAAYKWFAFASQPQ